MEKQELINSINTLSYCIDALVRAEQLEEMKEVVIKMLKLIKKL